MDEEELSENEERRLLEVFEQSALNDYPNPAREGCPGTAFLQQLAFHRKSISIRHPDLTHVTRCSPCFREFLRYRKQAARRRVFRQVAAFVCVAVLAVAISVYFTRAWSETRGDVIASLDLRNAVLLRGAAGSESRPAGDSARLPRKRLALTITLPLASQAGHYDVEVLKKGGKPLGSASGEAHIANGLTSMKVKLNLSNLSSGAYLIGIRRSALDWVYYPVELL